MLRSWVLCPIVTVIILVGCSADQGSPRSQKPSLATPTTPSSEEDSSRERRRCSEEIPFEPTYLPTGFDRELVEKRAPGGRPADSKNQVILHFSGSDDRAIEVRRPGTLFAELAQADDAPTIHVLGEDIAGFGPINPGGNEFMVFITYPSTADPENQCAWFSLNEVRVSLAELKKVAKGLRPNS